MEIKQLDRKDAVAYLTLRLEALQKNPEAFAASFEEEKNNPVEKYEKRFESPNNSFTFGAFDGGELVGTVTLLLESRIKLEHRANIVAMYVKEEKRGLGIGKTLLKTAIEKAKEIGGIEQIYLTVVTTNKVAKQLYQSFGFESYGVEKRALKYNGSYFDEEFMVLFL